jgi:hypothetical protein
VQVYEFLLAPSKTVLREISTLWCQRRMNQEVADRRPINETLKFQCYRVFDGTVNKDRRKNENSVY